MNNDLERPNGIKEKGVVLIVAGRRYSGWKSIRVTRSIETLSGSFTLDVSERWDSREPWPIVEEDECRVEVEGLAVIDGWVDRRSISVSKDARTLSYSGRDRAGALADCSAILESWTFKQVDVAEFVAKVAAPFGVRVSVQPGLKLAKLSKITFSPGDTAFDVIRRVAGDDSVLLVSDGQGGILITRAGTKRAPPLVEGQNILSASVDYDASDRFGTYVVTSQAAGTDETYGDDVLTVTGAGDGGVRRTHRVLVIQPDKGYDTGTAQRRADWEARMRAARAETVTIGVVGWKQPSGALWNVNEIAAVKAPRLLGVDGDMLITQVEYSMGDAGQVTQLRLVRPDAFAPSPQQGPVLKKWKGGGSGWPELGIPTRAQEGINALRDTIKKLTEG